MNADPEEPAYKHNIFKPQPAGYLTFAKYFNQTSYGEAGISWKKENNQFSVNINVPVGCRATVYIPVMEGNKITENGIPVAETKDVKNLEKEKGYQVFSVRSRNYSFVVE